MTDWLYIICREPRSTFHVEINIFLGENVNLILAVETLVLKETSIPVARKKELWSME